jgi:hypothetical protein
MKVRASVQALMSIPVEAVTEVNAELQEKIRSRAYELYEQCGKLDGYELEDWLQAENEILGRWSLAQAA